MGQYTLVPSPVSSTLPCRVLTTDVDSQHTPWQRGLTARGRVTDTCVAGMTVARGGPGMSTKTQKTNGLNATAATLRPLADRVVARALAREEMTKSGIMLPDTAKEKPMRATVVAVGEGRRAEDGTRIPLDVQAGDQILFAKYGRTEFRLDEEELLILSEKDILAVVAS